MEGWLANSYPTMERSCRRGFFFAGRCCVVCCAEPVKGSLRRMKNCALDRTCATHGDFLPSKKEKIVDIRGASHGRPRVLQRVHRSAAESLDRFFPPLPDRCLKRGHLTRKKVGPRPCCWALIRMEPRTICGSRFDSPTSQVRKARSAIESCGVGDDLLEF